MRGPLSLFPVSTCQLLTIVWLAVSTNAADAGMIELQNGTATFSQSFTGTTFSPEQAVDGDFSDPNGWAVATAFFTTPTADAAGSQTAVWETAQDVLSGDLTITMHFLHFNPGHLLGRFRFSVTTDDRSTFADGLATGGDVAANWTVLTSPTVTGPAGMTFSTLGDNSVLAGGTIAAQGVYTVKYTNLLDGVTGIRLEVIEDSSLPGGNGPGLHDENGNFLLTEMILDAPAVPEPSSLVLLGMGGLSLLGCGRRRNRRMSLTR